MCPSQPKLFLVCVLSTFLFGLKGAKVCSAFWQWNAESCCCDCNSTEVSGGEVESVSAGKVPVKLSPAPDGSFAGSFGSYGMERDSCPFLVWALTKADTS